MRNVSGHTSGEKSHVVLLLKYLFTCDHFVKVRIKELNVKRESKGTILLALSQPGHDVKTTLYGRQNNVHTTLC